MHPVTSAPPDSIATRFAQIMTGLRAALAAAYGRPALTGGGMDQPRRSLAPPLVLRLHRRLGAMMLAFAALVAHLAEYGADAPPRAPRRKRAPRPDAAAAPARETPPDTSSGPAAAQPESAPRPPRLPGNYGWLPGVSCGGAAGAGADAAPAELDAGRRSARRGPAAAPRTRGTETPAPPSPSPGAPAVTPVRHAAVAAHGHA